MSDLLTTRATQELCDFILNKLCYATTNIEEFLSLVKEDCVSLPELHYQALLNRLGTAYSAYYNISYGDSFFIAGKYFCLEDQQ